MMPSPAKTREEWEAQRLGLKITRGYDFVREQHDALGRYGGNVEVSGYWFHYADGSKHFECADAMHPDDYALFLSQQETDDTGIPYWPPSHERAA